MLIIIKDKDDLLEEKIQVEMTIKDLSFMATIIGCVPIVEQRRLINNSSSLKDEFKHALADSAMDLSHYNFNEMAEFLIGKNIYHS